MAEGLILEPDSKGLESGSTTATCPWARDCPEPQFPHIMMEILIVPTLLGGSEDQVR